MLSNFSATVGVAFRACPGPVALALVRMFEDGFARFPRFAVRRAIGKPIAVPVFAHLLEVVANQQRPAACGQIMEFAGFVVFTGDAAFEVCDGGHEGISHDSESSPQRLPSFVRQ